MKKLLVFVFAVVMIVASLFGAIQGSAPPDGYVIGVQMGTTLWGMRQAILEKPGTMMMVKDNLLMFMWTVDNGWAFATINTSSQSPIREFSEIAKGGNYVNVRTMSDLVDYLRGHGWRVIAAAEVPTAIKIALTASSSWFVTLASNMPTFVVVPAGASQPPILAELEGVDG